MKKKLVIALSALLVTGMAQADSWLYGGVSVGKSDYRSKDSEAYGIHVGTGILPILGLEAGYVKHGDFNYYNNKLKFSSLYAAVKPSIDIGPVQVYAKGGIHRWDVSGNFESSSKDDYGLVYGVGAEYTVVPMFAVGVSYMNFRIKSHDLNSFNVTASLNVF